MKYTARLGQNDEGWRVQELVDPEGEGYPGVEWDKIHPWWVVCLDDLEIVACAQVIASQPIGHIEFLNLDKILTPPQRAYAIKTIESYASLQLYANGVFVARSFIPREMKKWKQVVKKRWGVFQGDGGIYDMRVH